MLKITVTQILIYCSTENRKPFEINFGEVAKSDDEL